MDLLQITLIVVLIVLTLNTVAFTVYLVLVLKDLRRTVNKADLVIDDVHSVTSLVSSPVGTIMEMVKPLISSLLSSKKKGGK